MKKDRITVDAIKADFLKIAKCQMSHKTDWRIFYIIPITLIVLLVGILLKNILVGLLGFSVAAYHIVRFVIEYRNYKAKKLAISQICGRGDISISTETFSHVANDDVYEPHLVGRRAKPKKIITLYYFNGGSSWRVPETNKHYEWSRDLFISSKGLEIFRSRVMNSI